jgi:hypothetical protein
MKELLKSLLVTFVTTILALLVAEATFRVVSGKRVFALTPYRAANIVFTEFPKNVMSYDPLLGWRMNPKIKTPTFNTIDYGIRSNGAADDHARTGGVLVSGASFTAGSEVKDDDAWPALLETLIEQPVVNGAVGGFGADQIILRAEELLPIIKPQVLIIDLVQDNIATAGYSYSGYPKPYFTVANERLILHNNPVPLYEPRIDPYEPLKNVLSYSLIIDRVMAIYFPDAWYSSRTQNYTRANNDEVQVSCLLLQRLKTETDAAGIRLLVLMQYGAGTITASSQPDGNVRLVESCIGQTGIQLIDEFAALKELSRSRVDELKSLYVQERNGVLGHKSRAGNLVVARTVAAALALLPPTTSSSSLAAPKGQEVHAEERTGEVLLSAENLSSLFPSSSIARLEDNGDGAYRVTAIGGNTEHFLAGSIPSGNGTLTFSIEARASGSSHLRLQLLGYRGDGEVNGVLGDFDLRTASAGPWRIGLVENIGAGIRQLGDGWHRIWITSKLPPETSRGTILVQIVNERGEYAFIPDGDAVNVRHVRIERGEVPSENRAHALTANPG